MNEPVRRTRRSQETSSLIEQANQAADRLHAIIRDARTAVLEVDEAVSRLRVVMLEASKQADVHVKEMGETLRVALDAHVNQLGKATRKAMEDTYQKVLKEFDKVTDILMGKDPNTDEVELIETARMYRSVHETIQEQKRSVIPEPFRRPK